MFLKRIISLIAAFACTCALCCGQGLYQERNTKGKTTGKGLSEKANMTTGLMNADLPANGSMFKDDRFRDQSYRDLEKKMQEREWNNEESAWNKACELDSREGYTKYISLYPYGAHKVPAEQKLIEKNVDDVLKNKHNSLPKMERVYADDDSPSSTVTIENSTSYPLTVMYSGMDHRSIIIPPYQKSSVTLPNGHYRIAVSAPNPTILPFAGSENLAGGHYQAAYYIRYY